MKAQEILAFWAIEPQPIAQQLEPLATDMSVGQRKASRFEQDGAEIGHVEDVGAVGDRGGALGEQCRGHQLEDAVLGTPDDDVAGKAVPTCDKKAFTHNDTA